MATKKRQAKYSAFGLDQSGEEREVRIDGCYVLQITSPDGRKLDLSWDGEIQAFRLDASGPVTLEPDTDENFVVRVKRRRR